jgi:hypothetical protein
VTARLPEPPASDADVPRWAAQLGLPGLVDIHVHFLPEPVQRKVWAYFDNAEANYGRPWPIHYRYDEPTRVTILRDLAVRHYAPLVYAHKPGMAEWLNSWVLDFAERVPEAVPTATLYPEPEVTRYVGAALEAGARCVKVHVQVGGFDPTDPQLDRAWAMIAEAAVPVVVHCGHGPIRGAHTGLDVFEQVLNANPGLVTVLAHAGMPDYSEAAKLALRYPNVYLDTTMVGTAFTEVFAPIPPDWAELLVTLGDRIVFGTDFSQIPHEYAEQARVVHRWAASDERLGVEFLRRVLYTTPARLLGVSDQGQ